jgi:hypothetical protein
MGNNLKRDKIEPISNKLQKHRKNPIHNFDIKRDDGSAEFVRTGFPSMNDTQATAAQRLFRQPFPDLFEWIVPHMGDLPRPRRTLKTPKSQKPTLQAVPL